MKKLLQQLKDTTYVGSRKNPDGSLISERRYRTIERVADIAQEIAPGPSSAAKIADMVRSWSEDYGLKDGTIKLYLDVCKQATAGMNYEWPKFKRSEEEPVPVPNDIAVRWLEDPLPAEFTDNYDTDCFTAVKLAINSCLRPIDAVNVKMDNIGNGELLIKHKKTRKVVRSTIHYGVQMWLTDREEEYGDVFSPRWRTLDQNYRKRMVKDFIHRMLEYYGAADRVVVGMAAGEVSRKRLRDVITAKSLRSTGANLLLSMGVSAENVMAIGGWSSYDIFRKHYLKPNIEVWKP